MNYFISYCIDMEHIATDEEEKTKMKGFVELLTPVCKAYCSDKAVEICSLGMDVLGGYGYCSEYPMEQYLRDVKIATIYEGTNYIQSLDLVGRKLGQRKGQNLMNLFGAISATIEQAKKNEDLKTFASNLEGALAAVGDLTMSFAKWGKSMDYVIPVMNARPFLMILGDLVIGWRLLDAAGIAHEKLMALCRDAGADAAQANALAKDNTEVAFYQGKVASCKYFASNVVPSIEGRCTCIKQGDKTPVEMVQESFAI